MREIDIAQLARAIHGGAVVVDVRVPGARNIPMGHLTGMLLAQGFDAVNVAGGTSAWIRSGRTVEKG